MSEQSAAQRTTTTKEIDPDILALVVDETARRVEARAARPSPIHLRSWEEIERFAEKAARSGMVPKDFVGKPDAVAIAVQLGSELGLAPMQAVQSIAVINGRPAVWGDAMIGLCRASGIASYIREWFEGEGEAMTCYTEAKRKDDPTPIRKSFSVADAKRAGLWKDTPKTKKQGRDGPYEVDSGPWYSYPQRMLQMRARGFCLRDAFPDVLKGLISAEEARDIPWDETGLNIGAPPIGTAAAQDWDKPAGRLNEHVETNGGAAKAAGSNAPKRSIRDFIEAFRLAVNDAKHGPDAAEKIDHLLCSDDVMNAKKTFKNGALEQLEGVIADGLLFINSIHTPIENAAENDPDGGPHIAGQEYVGA